MKSLSLIDYSFGKDIKNVAIKPNMCYYISEVKGVILRIVFDAIIIEISHDVKNHRIHEGAYNLARSISCFPENTVHIGLVCNMKSIQTKSDCSLDPKPIIIDSEGAFLVGFDNGLKKVP